MLEKFEKSATIGSVILILTCAAFAFSVFAFVFLIYTGHGDENMPISILISLMVDLILLLVYSFKYHVPMRYMGVLRKSGRLDALNDTFPSSPSLPKTGVYLGSKSFYYARFNVIVPYDDILWAYVLIQKMYGVNLAKKLVLNSKSGFNFQIMKIDPVESKILLSHIAAASPDLIVGYNSENKSKYKKLVRQHKKNLI